MEYWTDYSTGSDAPLSGMRMPEKYVAEMFCDRLAACQNYNGAAYKDSDAYDYYMRSRSHYVMHPQTQALLEKLLIMLRDEGQPATFAYIRKEVLHNAR